MKRGKKLSTIVYSLFGIMVCSSLFGITAYAGDINGNEASVVAAANGTFEFNGKTYRAYPSYITTLENYLMQDDVDLSAEDASAAISEMYASVQEGVESQYLYEIGGDNTTTQATTQTTTQEKDKNDKNEEKNTEDDKDQDEIKKTGESSTVEKSDDSLDQKAEGKQDDATDGGKNTAKDKQAVEDDSSYVDAVKGLFSDSEENAKQESKDGLLIILAGVLGLGALVIIGKFVILLKKKSNAAPLIAACLEEGLTELHCHIIPGVDDGSKDMETSMKMVDIAYADGIRKIVATPHYIENHLRYDEEKLQKAFADFKEEVQKKYPDVACYLGNELYYSSEQSLERVKEGKVHTMAGSKYILIEFSTSVSYREMYKAMKGFVQARYYPVLAHMERFQCLTKHIERVDELAELGVYFQMNADSVLGKGADKNWCRKMMKGNRIQFLGTDAHGITHRTPEMQKAVKWICENLDYDDAEELLIQNPKKLLDNKRID